MPERNREVFLLSKLEGLKNREIAEKLNISENTVETHRKRLFVKLGARNMADLIVKAIACGYINAPEIMKDREARQGD